MDDTPQQLPKISASKIKTWQMCAKKYFYTYIDKPTLQREKKSIGGLLGTVLHRVIEAKYKNPEIDPLALYQEKMLSTLDEWHKEKHEITGEQWFFKSMNDGREILRNFGWSRFNPVELEYYFSLPFPDPQNPIATLIGYIDMIDKKTPLAFNVIDHKSQKEVPDAEDLAYDAQMILYRWAFFHISKAGYPDHVYWHNLRTGELINTHVEDNYQEKLDKLTEDIKAMLSATEYPKIELSDTCRKLCSFYSLCWGNDDVSTR